MDRGQSTSRKYLSSKKGALQLSTKSYTRGDQDFKTSRQRVSTSTILRSPRLFPSGSL